MARLTALCLSGRFSRIVATPSSRAMRIAPPTSALVPLLTKGAFGVLTAGMSSAAASIAFNEEHGVKPLAAPGMQGLEQHHLAVAGCCQPWVEHDHHPACRRADQPADALREQHRRRRQCDVHEAVVTGRGQPGLHQRVVDVRERDPSRITMAAGGADHVDPRTRTIAWAPEQQVRALDGQANRWVSAPAVSSRLQQHRQIGAPLRTAAAARCDRRGEQGERRPAPTAASTSWAHRSTAACQAAGSLPRVRQVLGDVELALPEQSNGWPR